MTDEYIWVIFVAEQTNRFPDFYPIGVFTVRDRAVEEIDKLPRDKNYQILRLPVNRMFPYYHKKSGGWLEWMRFVMSIFISRSWMNKSGPLTIEGGLII